jgi:hypothetical protein
MLKAMARAWKYCLYNRELEPENTTNHLHLNKHTSGTKLG